LYDVDGLLTYSQIGWLQQSAGALGNFALGQRWIVGDWLLGYNTALDSDFRPAAQSWQRRCGSLGRLPAFLHQLLLSAVGAVAAAR
jgi:Protein of unknown function (DUF3442).